MSQAPQEPSMEEILASIRRIISEDKKPKRPLSSQVKPTPASEEGDILELRNPLSENTDLPKNGGYSKESSGFQTPRAKTQQKASTPFLSEETVTASREAFYSLERFPVGNLGNKSLEEVVESALRPFLKEWLDANLPSLVKQVVREQVERITHAKMSS